MTKERESGIIMLVVETKHLGVAQFGSVLEWGSRGRWFNSSHPDHEIPVILEIAGIFIYADFGLIHCNKSLLHTLLHTHICFDSTKHTELPLSIAMNEFTYII